jgi:hypothetical protein
VGGTGVSGGAGEAIREGVTMGFERNRGRRGMG